MLLYRLADEKMKTYQHVVYGIYYFFLLLFVLVFIVEMKSFACFVKSSLFNKKKCIYCAPQLYIYIYTTQTPHPSPQTNRNHLGPQTIHKTCMIITSFSQAAATTKNKENCWCFHFLVGIFLSPENLYNFFFHNFSGFSVHITISTTFLYDMAVGIYESCIFYGCLVYYYDGEQYNNGVTKIV